MLWERVEIGFFKHIEGPWRRKFEDALTRKSPDFAYKVRLMRIVLPECGSFQDLQSLVGCVNACPNLETLHIHFNDPDASTLRNVFSGHTFPSIQTVVLQNQAYPILRSCPNAKTVHCSSGDGSRLVSAVAVGCQGVQVLTGIGLNMPIMEQIIKAAPNLRELRVFNCLERGVLVLLSRLKYLRLVGLETNIMSKDDVENDGRM